IDDTNWLWCPLSRLESESIWTLLGMKANPDHCYGGPQKVPVGFCAGTSVPRLVHLCATSVKAL
ncbi:MAG: hypothetical protein ACC652_10035, partial [Acidimicrobiales bacterium]